MNTKENFSVQYSFKVENPQIVAGKSEKVFRSKGSSGSRYKENQGFLNRRINKKSQVGSNLTFIVILFAGVPAKNSNKLFYTNETIVGIYTINAHFYIIYPSLKLQWYGFF